MRVQRLVDGSSQHDPATGQDDDPLADLDHVADDVRRKHRRRSPRADLVVEHVQELVARQWVQRRERLVEQQQRRMRAKGDCQCQLCALTTRQRPGALPKRDLELIQSRRGRLLVEARTKRASQLQMVVD